MRQVGSHDGSLLVDVPFHVSTVSGSDMIPAARPAHHDVLDDDLTLHRHLDSMAVTGRLVVMRQQGSFWMQMSSFSVASGGHTCVLEACTTDRLWACFKTGLGLNTFLAMTR